MLRFFEPEVVSSSSNRRRFKMRNDAVLPLLPPSSSSFLANTSAADEPRARNANKTIYSGSLHLNTLFSSTPINAVPGQATSMAGDHDMDKSKHNATTTDTRKHRKLHTEDLTSVRESKRQKFSACNAKQHNASSIDESSQQQLMMARGAAKKSQKLGDRITALQQMVSPFGKTDTASVLQEAGVCIKILHEHIRVLSTPYFGLEPPPAVPANGGMELGLRERGLCLVPITSTIENLSDREPTDSFVLERLGWGAGIRHH